MRTADAMLKKARAGHVTGGKVFGYQNVRVGKGHVERKILETEAAVMRTIYERHATGNGYRAIASYLNGKRLPSPGAQRGRPSGWDMGTVKAVLERGLYRGRIEYNCTKKRDAWGQQRITARPTDAWVVVNRAELAIISQELAERVDARRADRRARYLRSNDGKLMGQATHGKYLLTGLLRCPCGANFEAQKAPHGHRLGAVYVCAAHRRKGPAVCANRSRIADHDDR